MQTGLLDALGYVGSSLDKLGGRAVRGVLGGHPDELASVVPFSDRFGLTDPNRIVSGRNLTDQIGLTRQGDDSLLSHGAGMAAEIALDPTNLIGGGIAKSAASRATRMGGAAARAAKATERLGAHPVPAAAGMLIDPFKQDKRLSALADALGPRYPGGPEKLDTILGRGIGSLQGGSNGLHLGRLESIRNDIMGQHPSILEQVAGEVPEGSAYLGNGANAVALLTPQGHVVRIGTEGAVARPPIPEVMKPARSANLGGLNIEHLPLVKPLYTNSREHLASDIVNYQIPDTVKAHLSRMISDPGYAPSADYIHGVSRLQNAAELGKYKYNDSLYTSLPITEALTDQVQDRAAGQYRFWDNHPGNVAISQDGRRVMIPDADAVHAVPRELGPSPELLATLGRGEATDLMDIVGAHHAIRSAIGEGLKAKQGVLLSSLPRYEPQWSEMGQRMQNLDEWLRETKPLLESIRNGLPPGSEIPDAMTLEQIMAASRSPDQRALARAMPNLVREIAQNANISSLGEFSLIPGFDTGQAAGKAAAKAAAKGGGLDTKLRGLRSKFPVVQGEKITGPTADPEATFDAANYMMAHLHPAAGGYSATDQVAAVRKGAPSSVKRHEVGHGIVDQAVREGAGAVAGLPLAWQPGGFTRLAGSKLGNETLQGLGAYLDEIAQYGTQNRGMGNQLRGSTDFALTPEMAGFYAKLLASGNPLLAAMIQAPAYASTHALPLAAGVSGAGALARQLGD